MKPLTAAATPAEIAAAPPAVRADWLRSVVARLRSVADACDAAGVSHHGIGTGARAIQGQEAAWRGESACCARAAVGRSCECSAGLP